MNPTPDVSGSLAYWKRQALEWELRARRAEEKLHQASGTRGRVFTQEEVNSIVANRIRRSKHE